MIIYKSTAFEFDHDVRYNKVTKKLEDEFIRILGRKPSDSEKRSFSNSLSRMNDVLNNEGLVKKDCGVLIEYQLPSSSMRLDFMITGKDKFMNSNAVIVELKQWEKIEESNTARQVYTYTGGAFREVNHPAVQVAGYKRYLEDYQSAFHEGLENTIKLYACSYLHNYHLEENDKLLDLKFKPFIEEAPVFTGDDVREIGNFIRSNVEKGDGLELINKIEKSICQPSKKLIEHVNNIVDKKSEFILVEEQLIVFDRVMQIVKDHKLDGTDGRYVVLVKGGPGTGKSVVGLNLLAKILSEDTDCVYLAANGAFKNGMANKLDKNRAKVLFKHPYYYNKELTLSERCFQSAIIDEAHRISTTPPPMQKKLDKTLVEEIISKTFLTVFFTDDNQMIRPNDIGSYTHVKEMAEKHGCKLYEYELDAQFRCAGSEGYINWLDDVLGIRETANASGWENLDELEFCIVDDPNIMRDKISEHQMMGFSSRIVAGYAWPWSKELNEDGTLINDVKIYVKDQLIFEMPWNPYDSYKKKKSKGIPANTVEWAVDSKGVNQVGCIHTAQGLEFDYVGVIIGEEFKYDTNNDCWYADVEKCHDRKIGKKSKDDFIRLAQNTYKTLLTRGIKGVYVYAVDPSTQKYLKDRLSIVKKLEDERFYHHKKVDILKVFDTVPSRVADGIPLYGDKNIMRIEHYSISKLDGEYTYCDITDEKVLLDHLVSCGESSGNMDEELEAVLEDIPQIRYYSMISSPYSYDVGFMKFKAKAIVRRLVNDRLVVSLVF